VLAPASAAFDGRDKYQITAEAESGNRDYYSNGAPVVSPAGARYRMQVMPATARAPGFGLRPADPNNPADMNRLGTEYLDKMESKYGGDPAKMWGAYNAGPGRVDGLVKRYGGDWLKYAPRETQNYVSRNTRKLRGY